MSYYAILTMLLHLLRRSADLKWAGLFSICLPPPHAVFCVIHFSPPEAANRPIRTPENPEGVLRAFAPLYSYTVFCSIHSSPQKVGSEYPRSDLMFI